MSQHHLLLNASCMCCAALRPSPIASMTVAPPLTISPPAYTSLSDDFIVSSSTTIVLRLLTSSPSIDLGTKGFGETPTLTITRSTRTSSIAPSIGTGERRPEASGSPSSIFAIASTSLFPIHRLYILLDYAMS